MKWKPMSRQSKTVRMCLCCRQRSSKDDLFRLVRSEDDFLVWDQTGKTQARGYYICRKEDCLQKFDLRKRGQMKWRPGTLEELMSSLVADK